MLGPRCRTANHSLASLGSRTLPGAAGGAHAAPAWCADAELPLSSYSRSAPCLIYTPDTDKFLSQTRCSPGADLFAALYFSHSKSQGTEYVFSNSARQAFCIWWGAIYNGSWLSWEPASMAIWFQAGRDSGDEGLPYCFRALGKHPGTFQKEDLWSDTRGLLTWALHSTRHLRWKWSQLSREAHVGGESPWTPSPPRASLLLLPLLCRNPAPASRPLRSFPFGRISRASPPLSQNNRPWIFSLTNASCSHQS